MFALILSVLVVVSLSRTVLVEPPLCMICGCRPIKVSDVVYEDIVCSKLSFDIFEFWRKEPNNSLTHSLTIHYNDFQNLSSEFPYSPNLVHLNLAYNNIRRIYVSIFHKMDILDLLILSHNEIEAFLGNELEVRLFVTVSISISYQMISFIKYVFQITCS